MVPNMSDKKTPIPQQTPTQRNKNFSEVSLGYTDEMAINEAKRCLNCKSKPCVKGCPVNVNIPTFISLVSEGKFNEAYLEILKTNNLPAICGRVCPQETQCEKECVRNIKGESVAIGRLERFCADFYINRIKEDSGCNKKTTSYKSNNNKRKIGIIGSGPAGLTCAADLAKEGFDVTIFEAFHRPGGVLTYGIPEFRLPKDLVEKEIECVKKLGVTMITNMVIGKTLTIDELLNDGFDAIFISTGAGLPKFMNIPGENLNAVYASNEFLTRINLMKAYDFPFSDTPIWVGKNVAVIGGGNVAMDCARSAKRLGASNVHIIYRRSENELPARLEEVEHAKEEEVNFKLLTNPKQILGTDDGWVKSIECVKMKLGEMDSSGRRHPEEIKGSDFSIEVDTVIMAIGQRPNHLIPETTSDLILTKYGGINVNKNTNETSKKNVYAGGDVVTGAATVIEAMGAGKNAALAIIKNFCS